MTKEERIAKKYAEDIYDSHILGDDEFGIETIENAVLYGINIAKTQWHDLRKDPNDLPKDRHNVWIIYLNGYYQEEKSVASYRHKFWVMNGLKTECEVLAWCELPQFEEKIK